MKIKCPHCGTKAVITSHDKLKNTGMDLICQCANTKDCGASFIFTLAFKHTLKPPVQAANKSV